MGKFALECPNCGRYVQASTNIFAKNKIDCSCGYTINVKTDRLHLGLPSLRQYRGV